MVRKKEPMREFSTLDDSLKASIQIVGIEREALLHRSEVSTVINDEFDILGMSK